MPNINNLLSSVTFHSNKPNSAILGDMYYDDNDSSMYIWNGKWVKLQAASNYNYYLIKERKLKLDKIKKILENEN